MTQTIELPVGPHVQESHFPIPQSVSIPQAAQGSPSVLNNAELDQERGSLIDMCKVAAFLIVALVARGVLTEQHTNHVEGVSEPPVHVQSSKVASTLDLIDLSTVGF